MNRIHHSQQKKPSLTPTKRSPRSSTPSTGANICQQQSLFVPLHYEANYAYPLLVWLHGPNDGHHQIKQIMPHVSVRNYVAVAPAMPSLEETSDSPSRDYGSTDQCDRALDSSAGNLNVTDASSGESSRLDSNWDASLADEHVAHRLAKLGKRWEADACSGGQSLDDDEDARSAEHWGSTWQQSRDMIAAAHDAVEASIARATARCNIARHRIFLAGLESGGTMAIRLALSMPERFAGVASIGGPIPRGLQPMSNLLRVRQLPVLIAHGRDSQQYPVRQLCDELRLFHVAGMSLNVRQYPCGQELTTQMLSDLNSWMMQVVTGVDMDSSRESSGSYLPRSGAN